MSAERLSAISAYAAPWGKVTPLVNEVLKACYLDQMEMNIIQ